MPEGPETWRAAARLAKGVVGERIEEAWFAFERLKEHEGTLVGSRVTSIRPVGKVMITTFDVGLSLVTHNQLYGVWRTARRGERPDTRRTLRVALETSERANLLYSASEIALWPTAELSEHPMLCKLGPDVLDPELTVAQVEKRLRATAGARRTLAPLLLDQAFLAGMGNYLRSEVLFEAGLAPSRTLGSLTKPERSALAQALWSVPRASLAGRKKRGPERFELKVFVRAGRPCVRCGEAIAREAHAGRRLYRCLACQPEE